MAEIWPWLAVAGAGALHGLNPDTGWAWAWAAAWGLHSQGCAQALWAMLPIAAGHAASVALVARPADGYFDSASPATGLTGLAGVSPASA